MAAKKMAKSAKTKRKSATPEKASSKPKAPAPKKGAASSPNPARVVKAGKAGRAGKQDVPVKKAGAKKPSKAKESAKVTAKSGKVASKPISKVGVKGPAKGASKADKTTAKNSAKAPARGPTKADKVVAKSSAKAPPKSPAKADKVAAKSSAKAPAKSPASSASTPSKPTAARIPPPKKSEKGVLKPQKPAAPPRADQPRAPLVSIPMPLLTVERKPTIEERSASIEKRLQRQSADFRKRYDDNLEMSWIYHDSALEGVVYTLDELRAGFYGQPVPSPDSGLQPTYDEVRRHKAAIDMIRALAVDPARPPVTVALMRSLYLLLHPEEAKSGELKYRKEIPQHRLYFHEYAAPDKIPFKLRQIVDAINEQDPKKPGQTLRFAARAHYDILRVFPFATDSGKIARLVMNLLLLRAGLPPAIIHSAERQRYYDAVKASAVNLGQMVQDSIENALSSVERMLNEHESRTRSFAQ